MKRAASSVSKNASPTKRARKTISEDEFVKATGIEEHRLLLADADVAYIEDFIDPEQAQRWHDELDALDTWYQPTLNVYGREVTQSRHIAAYATSTDLRVKYSGTDVRMSCEWPPTLLEIKKMVEKRLSTHFNHCMLKCVG